VQFKLSHFDNSGMPHRNSNADDAWQVFLQSSDTLRGDALLGLEEPLVQQSLRFVSAYAGLERRAVSDPNAPVEHMETDSEDDIGHSVAEGAQTDDTDLQMDSSSSTHASQEA
jgi:hypothetical protein